MADRRDTCQCRDDDGPCSQCRIDMRARDLAARDAELERERMRLAACGVAALANTSKIVADRIDKTNPYWSASYGAVCDAVDREMSLRAEVTRLRGLVEDAFRGGYMFGWSDRERSPVGTIDLAQENERWARSGACECLAAQGDSGPVGPDVMVCAQHARGRGYPEYTCKPEDCPDCQKPMPCPSTPHIVACDKGARCVWLKLIPLVEGEQGQR